MNGVFVSSGAGRCAQESDSEEVMIKCHFDVLLVIRFAIIYIYIYIYVCVCVCVHLSGWCDHYCLCICSVEAYSLSLSHGPHILLFPLETPAAYFVISRAFFSFSFFVVWSLHNRSLGTRAFRQLASRAESSVNEVLVVVVIIIVVIIVAIFFF
ncbi:hypothetical protein, unlikely [Trypanosoma brucei gambiense DAL972]|uniref:Uncharacterized protein n=1 Tax=Trypanosoma brucei gambiense (strain MHOM/CI/86/DAL972) TaxID=679716 RepID=C9ZLH5_TRYB9|nr:hypothetical protein, unlikely [Trypanosoma brucei gambiense DAL972]CBH10184.1 hypothetical protein, unlikely [Trypanosoma brucei gambiense DAL972]|eukprot:XP_011772474.1 hypothetical protein, unlikely [Trypanosoma brucei gambiense DAL972]